MDVPDQLAACTDLLRWLDGQLAQQIAQRNPRDLTLARIVVEEASQLIERCRSALQGEESR